MEIRLATFCNWEVRGGLVKLAAVPFLETFLVHYSVAREIFTTVIPNSQMGKQRHRGENFVTWPVPQRQWGTEMRYSLELLSSSLYPTACTWTREKTTSVVFCIQPRSFQQDWKLTHLYQESEPIVLGIHSPQIRRVHFGYSYLRLQGSYKHCLSTTTKKSLSHV